MEGHGSGSEHGSDKSGNRRVGRRTFLTAAGTSAAGLTGLAGCLGGGDGGGGDEMASQIRVFLWEGWEPVVKDFEEETGITVNQENATSTNNMFTKTKNAPDRYDLVTPNSGYVSRFQEADLVSPIADSMDQMKEEVPNITNTYDYFRQGTIKRHLTNDAGAWFGAPPRFGLYGIGYDSESIDGNMVQASADVWENADALKDDVGVNVDEVHAITHAVRAAGYADKLRGEEMKVTGDAWQETREMFLQLADITRAMFESEAQVGRALKSDSYNVAVGPGRNDIVNMVQNGETSFKFNAPKEGAIGWTEAMLHPNESEKTEAVKEFMNFILKPEVGAKLATADLAPSVVSGAKEHMSEDEIELFYVPPEDVQNVIQDKPFAEPEKWKGLMNEFQTKL